jgi:hypothetical protein
MTSVDISSIADEIVQEVASTPETSVANVRAVSHLPPWARALRATVLTSAALRHQRFEERATPQSLGRVRALNARHDRPGRARSSRLDPS